MKTASPELIALLHNSTQFFMTDLYTITLINGTVLRYTSYDIDIDWNGNRFSSSGPVLERGSTKSSLGIEVDTLSIQVKASDTDTILDGIPFMKALKRGVFDKAILKLERLYMSSPGVGVGAIILFIGDLDVDEVGTTKGQLTVKSVTNRLNVKLPNNLYMPSCMWTLYDSSCGVAKAAYTVTGEVTTGSAINLVLCNLVQANGYYDMGVIAFTSGENTGLKRTVRSYTTGQVVVSPALPVAPANHDTFEIYPSCNRSMETCLSKFNNKSKFRGTPFIPTAEAAI